MNITQAQDLLARIISERGANSARLHRMGSGDYVVIIRKGGYYCWTPEDYTRWVQGVTCVICTHHTTRVRECSVCHRPVCATCRRVQGQIVLVNAPKGEQGLPSNVSTCPQW